MAQKECPDCGLVFSYEPNPNYPDKRKYCDECGAKRKAAYEASKGIAPTTPKKAAVGAVNAQTDPFLAPF